VARLIGVVCVVLVVLAVVVALLKDKDASTGKQAEQLATYQRIAIWHRLLQNYPDLPQKLETIIGEAEKPREVDRSSRTVEIRVHSREGVVDLTAQQIDVIVTDMSRDSLRELRRFLETVPEAARELGIEQPISSRIPSESSGPRVLVLGAEGRIEVKGPSGGTSQTIDLYHNEVTKAALLQVHAFGQVGQDAVPSITDYLERANVVRGPPKAEVRAGHVDKPPPEKIVIVAIGEINNLDIEGPRNRGSQTIRIEVETKVSRVVPADSEVGRAAEVGRSAHAAKVAEVAAAKAVESRGGGSRPHGEISLNNRSRSLRSSTRTSVNRSKPLLNPQRGAIFSVCGRTN